MKKRSQLPYSNEDGSCAYCGYNPEDDERLIKALKYAIKIIESYQIEIKNLKSYLGEGYSIEGFCQGTIYKEAIQDVKKLTGGKYDFQK